MFKKDLFRFWSVPLFYGPVRTKRDLSSSVPDPGVRLVHPAGSYFSRTGHRIPKSFTYEKVCHHTEFNYGLL